MSVRIHPALPEMEGNYLFREIEVQANVWKTTHPGEVLISLGIGDVTQPLAPVVTEALRIASAEMATHRHRRGYGPAEGYSFLREAIAREYAGLPVTIAPEEITVTHGAKEALGEILALFSPDIPVWVCDPVYPAYRDCARSAGHPVQPIPCAEENDFLPLPDAVTAPGLIFLCSPNNPTGSVLRRADWQLWLDFARESGSILITDSAYSYYINDNTIPHSVYAVRGAEECAIEIGSLSKSSGFTGLRCGWIVLPKALAVGGSPLTPHWRRWLSCHCNGVGYPIQRAAEAALSPTGKRQGAAALATYRRNAERLIQYFDEKDIPYLGGKHAPYLWVKCPEDSNSWDTFHWLLNECGILVTPGAGFGEAGEGWLRLTAFAEEWAVSEAIRRFQRIF